MSTRVVLATMPWQFLDVPNLAIGILRSCLQNSSNPSDRGSGADVVVEEYHGHLRFAEHLFTKTGGGISPPDYTKIAEIGLFHGTGDWVFATALYGAPVRPAEDFAQFLASKRADPGAAFAMAEHAADFIAEAAEEILGHDPTVVGCTSTFMQNVPSLAVLRRIKQLRPDVVTVMGGGNCDGPMGAALHRNFPFVDLVVRGEGERAIVAIVAALAAGETARTFPSVPGLCWRDADGGGHANPMTTVSLPLDTVPGPDYDGYFTALRGSFLQPYIEPKLVMETSRGCWWGEKHQCTFCGLNGSAITFRSRKPEWVIDEVERLTNRHRNLDIIMVDNIIDHRYFRSVLPALAEKDWDLRIHYEVKSNLSTSDIDALAKARVAHVQPGIESLHSRPLKLMDKGVSGLQNVRTLRLCEERGLTVAWNYLYGFPGEADEDYLEVARQFPRLAHLQPPAAATRIELERFSPNFEQPALGFERRRPAPFYDFFYTLPPDELADLVYLFETDDRGIAGDAEQRLLEAVENWRKVYFHSRLWLSDGPDGELRVVDERHGVSSAITVIDPGRDAEVFQRCLDGTSRRRLVADFGTAAERLLDEWDGRDLLFWEGNRVLALPVREGHGYWKMDQR